TSFSRDWSSDVCSSDLTSPNSSAHAAPSASTTPDPQLERFQQQVAEGHTRIPVVREVLSDLDTPLSVYLKLADGPHTYLFESVRSEERRVGNQYTHQLR